MPSTKRLPSATELASIHQLALLKRDQLAVALGYSRRTIDNLVARKQILCISLGKRNTRFDLKAVLRALGRFTIEEVR
jgi:hypothetical protein